MNKRAIRLDYSNEAIIPKRISTKVHESTYTHTLHTPQNPIYLPLYVPSVECVDVLMCHTC